MKKFFSSVRCPECDATNSQRFIKLWPRYDAKDIGQASFTCQNCGHSYHTHIKEVNYEKRSRIC
jgi:transposase